MAKQNHRTLSSETHTLISQGKVSQEKVVRYLRLIDRIEKEILPHPIIRHNAFTAWFKDGSATRDQVRHFLVQFSVFSNLFIEAQLKKAINAPSLEAMRASKEILMNELGVVFKSKQKTSQAAPNSSASEDDLVQEEGTVDGGMFKFQAAHFEWLLRMTSHVGLTFNDVGKRRHGTKSTLFFCDELARLYGSEDPHVALGASFSVENWAAAGFWKELISGLEAFKKRECPQMPLSFFTWHDRVEDQHAQHTWEELEESYFAMDLDEDKFIQGGVEMLKGVEAFWTGLNEDRLGHSRRQTA